MKKKHKSAMDNFGFFLTDKMYDGEKEIKKMMEWIQEWFDKGLTIPEIAWNFWSTFDAALGNIRFNEIQKLGKAKKKK